jgi:CRISPR system Cascade subunit CasE
MYISKASLRHNAATNKNFWKLVKDFGDNYKIHNLVWSMFSEDSDKKRDFLFRQEESNGQPLFYIVSEEEPKDQNCLWNVESKKYNPYLHNGQKLIFSLRANPIVTKRDENGKQHRHDIVMDAKTKLEAEGSQKNKRPDSFEIAQREGLEWLRKKGDSNGFEICENQVIATGYRTNRFFKPKGHHSVSISTIDFSGILTIKDPEVFLNTLYQGVGPAKSFGCGLLLVRPSK